MLKYADKFEEEISGVSTNRDSFGLIKDRYYLKVLYGWDDKIKFDFFDKYYKNVLEECTMLSDANKVIRKLKDENANIDSKEIVRVNNWNEIYKEIKKYKSIII